MSQGPVILCLGPAGRETAKRVRDCLPEAAIVELEKGRFFKGIGDVFKQSVPIIGICAAGILIRAVAPLLKDKRTDPPVLAVAADGSVVAPLIGGHQGANALARTIAEGLGIEPAITTASDTLLGFVLDEPPSGWGMSNPEKAKPLMAALLANEPVALEGEADWLGSGFVAKASLTVRVTEKAVGAEFALHPPILALGVGCERGLPAEELETLARRTLAENGLSEKSVACVVSHEVKADEEAVLSLARSLGVPARFFTTEELEAQTPNLANPSDRVFAEVGCHGVAEGAALAATGGALIVPKAKGKRATCAVALSTAPLDPTRIGRARGKLYVVGTGPGWEAWRTPEVSRAVAASDALVGYGLYLDLLGEAAMGKERFETDLGEEERRARKALELAAEGRTVSLVCSGDPGVFALATLVFEVLEKDPALQKVEVQVCPGISALQAAAARAGAPLGHDFCAISLSDLLTPKDVILKRLEAAAVGDFVTAFYNPVSKRRRDLLEKARDILLVHRPPTTPVILARNLGREGEEVRVINLADLTTDDADMLTLVMVGNSETRRTGGWVYTPRGYAGKGL